MVELADVVDSQQKKKETQRAINRAYKAKSEAKKRNTLQFGTPEEKGQIVAQKNKSKELRQKKRKTLNKKERSMKATTSPAQKKIIATRSSTASPIKKATKKGKCARETIINDEVSDFLNRIAGKAKNIPKLVETAENFFWCTMSGRLTGNDKPPRGLETAMWYKPSASEFHKWFTVKESVLPKKHYDSTEGYGLFAERHFYQGDVISLYLGKKVSSMFESDYCMDYQTAKGIVRIATAGGFPKSVKMYLGTHMINDINWNAKGETVRTDCYNVSFQTNLGLMAIKDIKPGEELYVDYNYDGSAFI